MRILVVGGSSFVGRHTVQSLLDRGHDVTLFNRGNTNPELFPDAERLTGDRNGDLAPLRGRSWDATVDVCAYVPRQVRSLLEALGDGAGHYTLVSTVSVYAEGAPEGYDESATLVDPAWDDELTMERYGALKVACEQVAQEHAPGDLLVVRPGYVVGPYDPTHRFTYWVERVAEGRSPIAGPDAEQPLQVVDGRDLGAFTALNVEVGTAGAFHVVAPYPARTFHETLVGIAAGAGVALPEVQWLGGRDDLPLAEPERSWWSLMVADPAAAVVAGLSWRPLEETARDTLTWVREARAAGTYRPREGVGLSPEAEAALLASR